MPEISRSQLVAYAAFAILVVAIGVRFMRGGQPASAARGAPVAAAGGSGERSPGDGTVRVAQPAATGSVVHVAGAGPPPCVYPLPAGGPVLVGGGGGGGRRASGGDKPRHNHADGGRQRADRRLR